MPPGNADTFPPFACHCAPARCYANTWQIFACHCEERSDVAIRSPAAARNEKQYFGRIRKARRICPNSSQLARLLCGENGLPRQCAHWLAMTCRRKDVCAGARTSPTVIARSEATWQSASPAAARNEKQYFGRIRESAYEFARTAASLPGSSAGTRIATPVCALARNDRLGRCVRICPAPRCCNR